jgi:hypothetical protein
LAASCTYPYLLLEASQLEMLRPSPHVQCPPLVLDAFFRELSLLGIPLLWLPAGSTSGARRRLGELIVRLMLSHVLFPAPDWCDPP